MMSLSADGISIGAYDVDRRAIAVDAQTFSRMWLRHGSDVYFPLVFPHCLGASIRVKNASVWKTPLRADFVWMSVGRIEKTPRHPGAAMKGTRLYG